MPVRNSIQNLWKISIRFVLFHLSVRYFMVSSPKRYYGSLEIWNLNRRSSNRLNWREKKRKCQKSRAHFSNISKTWPGHSYQNLLDTLPNSLVKWPAQWSGQRKSSLVAAYKWLPWEEEREIFMIRYCYPLGSSHTHRRRGTYHKATLSTTDFDFLRAKKMEIIRVKIMADDCILCLQWRRSTINFLACARPRICYFFG